ncbi:hemolysin family protein [Agathobacter rectalis]|jgi:putative hemolysin|uniref:Hemolysin n=1 Tax=Agathobacter rectalis TaxID=39491 RepID=A0A2U2EKB6_9FIRM|nr:hemolysin family protein [Agathobacter rectalis]PWE84938.1 hemolysin [Agathobacter rectalis]
MLYAIIILSILVVILLLCIGVLLYGMKNNKKTLDGILGNDDVTEEEIISMVREGHEQGTILASEAEMIHNVFEFDDKEVKDIMTHRKNIVSLDGNMSFIDAIEFIIDTGKSRFPVYENDVDSIIGVLHIKDAFTFFEKNEVYRSSIKDIDGLIRPVDFIPETVNINDLFKKMQSKKSHLAMVVDEYGQISGLIAMEDILEELVGNIEDEHDEEENYIRKSDDETFIMDGMTEFSDVKEALSLPVDDDAYETLNGFIISLSDKIPEEGDKTVISAYGYRFSVMSVEDKVIKQVMIKKLAPEEKK